MTDTQPRWSVRTSLLLLALGLSSCASTVAPPASRHWDCFAAADALERKQHVVLGVLPNVYFIDEDKPSRIEDRLLHHKVPALSVAVIRNGKLDWTAAWGELEANGSRAGCESLFQAGSIAKPVAVLAALRMQQEQQIDFDKNIETYLTSYHLPAGKQTDQNPVTLNNLFEHTSGLTPGGYMGYGPGEAIPTDHQTVRGEPPSNARKVEVLSAPGSGLAYSGGGYTVAEIALQDRLHKPFEQLMDEWLLAPVGMKQADFTQPLPIASQEITARGHVADGSAVPGGWHNHPEQAAAGLWASASDLAALLVEIEKAYRGESRVFSQAGIRQLLAKHVEGHAYGFRLVGEGDRIFLTHYGATVGYRAGMTLNLETGDGAVFLSNSDNGADLGLEFLGAVSRVYGWPVFREIRVERATQMPEVLQSLAGAYTFAAQGWRIEVVFEGGRLAVVFPNGDRYFMTPIQGAPLEFIHPDTAVRASFDREAGEVRIHLYGQIGLRQAGSK